MSTLVRSVESAPTKSAIPQIVLHPAFLPSSGLRAQTIQAIIKQHRKVLIFTSAVVRSLVAEEATKAGVPVTNLSDSVLATDRIEALEAFEKAEERVLIASPYSAAGWRIEAKCIVLCELHLPRTNGYLYQMVTRARTSEINAVNCRYPPSVVADLEEVFAGYPCFLDEIESALKTQ